MVNLRAVILASGRGARFDPITKFRPKPLLPAASQPILRYLLQSIMAAGFTDIIITLGYLAPQIENFLSTLPSNISFNPVFASKWFKGPLSSLTSAIPYLDDEPFVLLPADLYISATNIRHILDSTEDEFAILYDPNKSPTGPVVKLGKDNLVTKFSMFSTIESNAKPILPILNSTPQLFSLMKEPPGNKATTVFELLQLWIKKGHSIKAIPIETETWFDVDFPIDLINLNNHLLTTAWPPTPIPSGEYIASNTHLDGPLNNESLSIGEQTQVKGPVLLGIDIEIGNKCTIGPGTSLGANTIVEDNTMLSHCITLPHTRVPSNAELRNAILDQEGNIIHGSPQTKKI